ncbi:MAG TPA: pyridoxal 5'-phosphate synthase glutaminase subunit PdxT [Solirubrobacterales bacterium]|nr:pyridoxal 5'-phosphate synthase glutaminase subunit PdxT [Solirubrobacterales bacterium]
MPGGSADRLRVGVLASQGDFAAHLRVLADLGADGREVRTPEDFAELDALVIPGGESTTISKAIERDGLEAPIRAHFDAGRPILGTCAGMIVCDRGHLGLIDATARRNAFGRQLQSFEADLEFEPASGIGPDPIRAAFIRAPWIESHGAGVEVLASWDGHPVAIREGNVLVCSFHPELAGDSRVHALLMAMATAARERVAEEAG